MEAEKLTALIAEQGAKVKQMKADGKSKDEVKPEVDILLQLKKDLEALTTGPKEDAVEAGGPSADVTPFKVEAIVDYTRLMREFGTQPIDEKLLARLQALADKRGIKMHQFIRRGLFYSHRSLGEILDLAEKGKPFYLYTGRGPSSDALHFGHLMPFMFTKFLQQLFDVPLVIQLTDDEKMLWKDFDPVTMRKMLLANVRDIIAVGFDPKKTFIFANTDYMGAMYPTVVKIWRVITANQVRGALGLTGEDNIGKWAFTAIQAAPAFPSCFPHLFKQDLDKIMCLIPCAIDQDPFFRITRDIAGRIGFQKPSVIHSKFFPALQGSNTKMSASSKESAIYVTDTDKEIKDKINKHAFSGGKDTAEEHREKGGNCDVDVSYQYLTVFLEDDVELERIRKEYTEGRMLTGELKKILITLLQDMVHQHNERKALVTDEVIQQYMTPRHLD